MPQSYVAMNMSLRQHRQCRSRRIRRRCDVSKVNVSDFAISWVIPWITYVDRLSFSSQKVGAQVFFANVLAVVPNVNLVVNADLKLDVVPDIELEVMLWVATIVPMSQRSGPEMEPRGAWVDIYSRRALLICRATNENTRP